MKVIDFPVEGNEIHIVPLADLHIGSPQADLELIKETCDYIAHTDGFFTILNGDLIDHITTTSVGSVFEATMDTKNQVTSAVYYLRELAEKKKIINVVSGNHELRPTGDGLTPIDLILAHLMNYDDTLNERYCEDGAFTFITMKNRAAGNTLSTATFTVFNIHGSGSGRKIGGKVQRLDDLSQVVPANVYITSHNHQPETHRGVFYDVNTQKKTVREQPCVYVSTNSYLKYGGYGARAGMKPLSRGIPVITLRATRTVRHNKESIKRTIECVIKDHLGD